MQRTDKELDRLLARGDLSGPARDRIRERLGLSGAPRRRPIFFKIRTLLAPAAALAVAAAVFIVVRRGDSDALSFRAKGNSSVPNVVSVLCSNGTTVCTRPDRFFFRVRPSTAPRWLSAYARKHAAASPSNARIEIFPVHGEPKGYPLPASAEAFILPKAVEVPLEWEPGRYDIVVAVSGDIADATTTASIEVK
jgi:hypothetical protein